jgi:hypothetical protein
MESSALPAANRAVRPGEYLIWNRPRNSYDLLMSGLKINVHQAAPPNITCYVHLHNT